MSASLPNRAAHKRIIVCVDDFGLTDGGSDAAIDLASRAAISAVSCVVDGPVAARRADALCAPSLPISLGLHFNLTDPSTSPGHSGLRSWLLRAYVLHSIDVPAIRAELRRQLERFEDLFGRPPAFVDGHQHVHQFHGIADVLVDELTERYGTRVAVRTTVPRQGRGLKARAIAQLGGNTLRELLRDRQIATNTDFAGVYDFSARVPYARRMRTWIDSIADRGLIMCHPERTTSGGASTARILEYSFLASAAWVELRRQSGASLIQFGSTA